MPATNQNSAQGAQGRLALVRAELLPPLPPGCAPCGAGGYVHDPRRLSLCPPRKGQVMSNKGTRDDTNGKERVLNRRSILLGGTTIAAASALAASASIR